MSSFTYFFLIGLAGVVLFILNCTLGLIVYGLLYAVLVAIVVGFSKLFRVQISERAAFIGTKMMMAFPAAGGIISCSLSLFGFVMAWDQTGSILLRLILIGGGLVMTYYLAYCVSQLDRSFRFNDTSKVHQF